MIIPHIIRDETKTRIRNIDIIINSLFECYDIRGLNNYLVYLDNQNNLSKKEINSIKEVVNERIFELNKFNEDYLKCRNDFDLLNNFYDNSIVVEKLYYMESDIVLNFLTFCIESMENGILISLNNQKLFDKTCNYYVSYKKGLDDLFDIKVFDIIKRKEALRDKVDIDYDGYKEDDYLSRTQVLSLSNDKKGHSLTEDEYLNNKAFIGVAIILEGTLLISFIVGMIMLFR